MIKYLASDWANLLRDELDKEYFSKLSDLVTGAYGSGTVYPPASQVFSALNLCLPEQTKVIIIGQDPYHGPGQAHGLSFSVNEGIKQPPSLKNIFKELQTDIPGFEPPLSGNLEGWARQGVLLLNAILTVSAGQPGSHKHFGWEQFTNAVIRLINEKTKHRVFMLWGNYALQKKELIEQNRHLVLQAAHPSPLARGAFFGNKHFSLCNRYLETHGITPVNWQLRR